MREEYNVEWVFAFQQKIREAVKSYFGDVEDWPFLRGCDLKLMSGLANI
jgi:hypothetical protein